MWILVVRCRLRVVGQSVWIGEESGYGHENYSAGGVGPAVLVVDDALVAAAVQ